MALASDIGLASLALGIEAVKRLVEAFIGRLARINRAAFDPDRGDWGVGKSLYIPGLRRTGSSAAKVRCFSPKNFGPDQRVPVIARAT